jgi:hypothetical protein
MMTQCKSIVLRDSYILVQTDSKLMLSSELERNHVGTKRPIDQVELCLCRLISMASFDGSSLERISLKRKFDQLVFQ